MLKISQEMLSQIYKESERRHPEEACGFILGKVDDGDRVAELVVECENIQNKVHAQDPERYTRDAKTAYTIDPKQMEAVQKQAADKGLEIISIFHSHPEHGVYFSDEDKGMAAPWGEPLFPSISYVVVSVYDGQVKNASDFYWSGETKDFEENKIK